MPSYSPLATRTRKLAGHGKRKGKVRGIILHTTGGSIVAQALAKKADPLAYAVDYYLSSELGPTYVIGHDGSKVQIADEDKVTWHAGLKAAELQAYLNGSWRQKLKLKGVEHWDACWNKRGIYDPRHLVGAHEDGFLGVNEHFIGIEMTPLSTPKGGGLRFTDRQTVAAGALCADIMARHGLLGHEPWKVVLAHEDVNPLARFDKGGGWDPGILREKPYFDMKIVMDMLGGKR